MRKQYAVIQDGVIIHGVGETKADAITRTVNLTTLSEIEIVSKIKDGWFDICEISKEIYEAAKDGSRESCMKAYDIFDQ